VGKGKGPVEVRGCGHLIHKDGPGEVAREVVDLLEKVEGVKSKI
jgi:pimeloyl-ACP methyl ester carboxylesterase